jgi:ABC-type glycerol-3-phosphate transport system permease component
MGERTIALPQLRARGRAAPSGEGWRWSRAAIYAVLIAGAVLAVAPFLWMVSMSFMSPGEIVIGRVFPEQLLFSNYADAWQRANFAQYMWNSARITVIQVVGTLLVCVPAAYAFARMNFVGKNIVFTLMIATMMIPEIVTLIPNFLTVVWIGRLSASVCGESCGWLNNWPSLTVPFMGSAFSIFLLRQFFTQIPQDFWDAAQIDGAGHFTFLRRVVLPLSRAPLMTVVIFTFINSWNALLWPLIVVQTDDWRPVALGLQKFISADAGGLFQLQMAASVLMTLPVIALYFITQRQFTEGIVSSGLKG